MVDDLFGEIDKTKGIPSIITVAGIGGGGGNAVNHMYRQGIMGVNFMVCNTDSQAVGKSPILRKIVMGPGLGAGNDPKRGREAAIESLDAIRECFDMLGTQMLFLTAGMGGGTGTGATPVIAKLAREMGILTVAIVTTPFTSEGSKRVKQAHEGMEELAKYVDSMLVIENDSIVKIYGDLPVYAAFRQADDILAKAAKGIAELITIGGTHNVDFADVRNVLRDSGRVHMSVASADGEDRIEELIDRSLNSPLMDRPITGARDAIINISAASFDEGITLSETERIREAIRKAAGPNARGEDINIIWGTTVKEELGSALEMILVAANFDESLGQNDAARTNDRGPERIGGRTNRYADIESVYNIPAYQRRKFKMVVADGSTRGQGGTVVRFRGGGKEQPQTDISSLFDMQNDD